MNDKGGKILARICIWLRETCYFSFNCEWKEKRYDIAERRELKKILCEYVVIFFSHILIQKIPQENVYVNCVLVKRDIIATDFVIYSTEGCSLIHKNESAYEDHQHKTQKTKNITT